MNLRALPVQLHPVAEEAVRFFRDDRGVTGFEPEQAVEARMDYRPTLSSTNSEHHDIWIEVSESPYLRSLDSVVLYAVTHCLPVKLYVAFPVGIASADYKKCIDEARRNGVGAIEVSPGHCNVIHEALLLSLHGLRTEDRTQFPVRYRSVLASAEATFRSGDPAKGCSLVYDQIESLSRRLARKIHRKGWWNRHGAPQVNLEIGPWARVMDGLIERTNYSAVNGVTKNLLMRVASLTEHRNQSGHYPGNRAALVRRDRELRTRFETAVDLLRDLVKSTSSLRL